MTPAFDITARDPGSRARAGLLRTAHGVVRTPAFTPLATKGVVRGISAAEVAALGYDMVLGNTFHLWLEPGHDLVAGFGGLHEFMGWDRPIITDSGGFQVFSMGYGNVSDEIKKTGTGPGGKSVLGITEDGVTFRSPREGSKLFMAPETSMEIQAALNADIALVFDECTPFHVDREYTARSTERTHRWLQRCLDWHARHGPGHQLVYGIVQGGVYEDLRVESAETIAASAVDGIAIGGSLGADKPQMHAVVDMTTAVLGGRVEGKPRHLLGIGEVDDLIRGVELGIDTFDCVTPTRLGRHGGVLVPEPDRRFRLDLTAARYKTSTDPIEDGCPCAACAGGHSRGYLRYLAKNRELTGQRLLTLHNLTYLARLMRDLRDAIAAGTLAETAAALRAGAPPSVAPVELLSGGPAATAAPS
jgi:queuine tRNA-ribosyltransferase